MENNITNRGLCYFVYGHILIGGEWGGIKIMQKEWLSQNCDKEGKMGKSIIRKENWKHFEKAVYSFIEALFPYPEAKYNVIEADSHSGFRRQRDIIIETRIRNIIPVKILISCKAIKRKLNQNDIDTFQGNIDSSNADIGIIYSESGFTKPALINAKNRGINCCNLYQNKPASIPDLLFLNSYCCVPMLKFGTSGTLGNSDSLKSYNDLFNLPVETEENILVIDWIVKKWKNFEKTHIKENINSKFYTKEFKFHLGALGNPHDKEFILNIVILVKWKIYRAKTEAHLVNGSYSYNTKEFFGEQKAPFIDLKGSEPGPGWELISAEDVMDDFKMVTILYGGDLKTALLDQFSSKPIQLR